MKRYMIVILMVVMSFSLSACNTDEKDKDIVNEKYNYEIINNNPIKVLRA